MRYLNLVRNVRNWPSYLTFKMGINTKDPVFFNLRQGSLRLKMIPSMKPLFREIFLKEVYGPALKSTNGGKPLIIDVGGNMGYFAMYSFLKKPGARVFSFEPVPENFKHLQKHKEAHPNLDWSLFNTAVSDKEGAFDFYYNDGHSPEGVDVSASLFPSDRIFTVHGNHKKITVPVIDLKKWMGENNISHCDILKLDCEGAEYSILYSIPDEYFPSIRYIVADVHRMSGEDENIESLASFLKEKGYWVKTVNSEILYAGYNA
ncbi:MAG: hypothetical protein ABS46_17230 [Cytophagaceae bacterium SCN 52-12]|nr:MAG: hypothetical protein ABS46_17230 [Cytophagaceae bacterium SCN 52-12]